MRGISLWQPYASALFTAHPQIPGEMVKTHETRGWACPPNVIGETVFIHAAKKRCTVSDIGLEAVLAAHEVFGRDWQDALPRGAILGTVRIVSCIPTFGPGAPREIDRLNRLFGDWTPGRYAFGIANPKPFETPIPASGNQGWWFRDVPEPSPARAPL